MSLHLEISPPSLPHSKERGRVWWQHFHSITHRFSCEIWSYLHISFLFLTSVG